MRPESRAKTNSCQTIARSHWETCLVFFEMDEVNARLGDRGNYASTSNASCVVRSEKRAPSRQEGTVNQLAFARSDRVKVVLNDARPVDPVRLGLERQIHTNDMAQQTLTRRRIPVKIRSPRGPAELQSGFHVSVAHTRNVNSVKMMILLNFKLNEGRAESGLPGNSNEV